jgi:serine phosphatase RsbU (regulator of sigma subunit)
MANNQVHALFGACSSAAKLIVAALGALTIIGWIANIEVLASLRRNYIPMAPSTAVAFACLGAAMWWRTWSGMWRWISMSLVALVAALALAKLLEFLLRTSFGIDEFFVADPASFGQVRKGRMSPITAGSFLLSCAAILAAHTLRWRNVGGLLATILLGVNSVVLLGYLHGTPVLYGATIIPVALPTAAAFFLLAISSVLDAGPEHWPLRAFVGDSAKALLLRWFLPAVLGLTVAIDLLCARMLDAVVLNPGVLSAISTLIFVVATTALVSQVAMLVGGRIDRAEAERNLAQKDLELLNQNLEQTVADRTQELRFRNEQMQEELQMARELQFAMLPKRFPTIPENARSEESLLGFFSFYLPTGEVSGDFFNVFPVSKTSVGVLICDVMGHGVRAALVAGMMRALTEQHTHTGCDAGKLLSRLNESLHAILSQSATTMFATGLVVIVDAALGKYFYASAGHPKPLHYRRAREQTVCLEGASGPALGIFKEAKYKTAEASMEHGDLLMLFTDGLFEVENAEAELYSHADLLNEVRKHSGLPAEALLEQVVREVRRFSGAAAFEDDVCLVGVEYRQPPGKEGSSDG